MNRILIVNVNWLGDVLFSTPAIRAIRKWLPESYIACLVPPRCAGLLKNNPYLNEVIVSHDRHSFFAWPELFKTVQELKKKRFDTAIFFHRSKTKVLMTVLAGIPERLGFWAPGRRRLLTRVVPLPEAPLHKTDLFLNLIEHLGIPADGRTPDFFPGQGTEGELRALLESHGILPGTPYAVVHAGGNWDLKRWPASYFVEWIRLLLQNYSWKVILCGTSKEEALSKEIQAPFDDKEVINLCGKTSLDALALMIKNAKLLLSNDSGPIHLAASQKTKIVGLFGPTSPELTGPISAGQAVIVKKDVGCEVPCYFKSCNYRVCMEWLSPQEVFEKTKELYARSL